MIDYILYFLVKAINLLFRILPISFILFLGRVSGRLIYCLKIERKSVAYANLKAAFCREKNPAELKKLLRKTYTGLVETFFEVLALTKVNKKYVEKYINIVNKERIYNIKNHPNGVILLTAHFGNWELSGIVSSIEGFPLVVLAREQRMKRLNELLNTLRESKGLKVVRKGVTTKDILKALHQGKMIGMVSDQNAGKTGIFVNFFGRPASTAPGATVIAAKTGAYILPAFIARIKGPYHRLTLEEPIKITKDEDVRPYLERYNKLLEGYIRKHPEQWLWFHKRWKSTPLKKILILNDGKPGHLNQSIGLSKLLKRYREDSGYIAVDTEVEIVEVRFKNVFSKLFLKIMSLFSSPACQGCMGCLKLCLTKKSYENLMRRYCDIVISCGAAISSVNRFITVENNAKNAVLMRPSPRRFDWFNMVIIPVHDVPDREKNYMRDAENIILTTIVPNVIDEDYMEYTKKKFLSQLRFEGRIKIGVLLGGDNRDFYITEMITEDLVSNILNAAKKLDADILFTTSRRTPLYIEKIIKEKLHRERRCKWLVLANERNIPDVVGGILALSDLVCVSGESSTMVSEAVSSGKKVIVYTLKKRRRKPSKFELMMEELKEKGKIVITSPDNLSEAILRLSHIPCGRMSSYKNNAIYRNMWRIL